MAETLDTHELEDFSELITKNEELFKEFLMDKTRLLAGDEKSVFTHTYHYDSNGYYYVSNYNKTVTYCHYNRLNNINCSFFNKFKLYLKLRKIT